MYENVLIFQKRTLQHLEKNCNQPEKNCINSQMKRELNA